LRLSAARTQKTSYDFFNELA